VFPLSRETTCTCSAFAFNELNDDDDDDDEDDDAFNRGKTRVVKCS